ncbi:MAG: DUF4382 domain-containing protein [Planctomycetota bacterium]
MTCKTYLVALLALTWSAVAWADEAANLRVFLTDTSGSSGIYDRVIVAFDEVSVQGADGVWSTLPLGAGENGSGIDLIRGTSRDVVAVDLLELQGIKVMLAADDEEPGTYTTLRLGIAWCTVVAGGSGHAGHRFYEPH